MRPSYGWPITLAVVMITLVIALLVGWVVLTVREVDKSAAFWVLLLVGTLFLVLVLVGVVLYLLISIKGIRLSQRQSNFVDSVSHELKSPIASLKLYLQTLSRRSVSEQEQANFFRFMLEDVERLDGLINHMLDAARLDQEPLEADIVDVELSDVLASCAETACLRYRLPLDIMRLRINPAVVRARPVDLEMVFRNLIDNAIKYGGPAGEVTIRGEHVFAAPPGAGPLTGRAALRVVVSDRGQGIAREHLPRVTERFFRVDPARSRQLGGTGLGLAIVKHILRRHRGHLAIESELGRGTTVTVFLPLRAT
jgi:signal transduction histidine kinase